MVGIIVAMSVVLCAVALLISYQMYFRKNRAFYEQLGRTASQAVASRLTPEELDRYYQTNQTDEHYDQIMEFLWDLVDSSGALYIYVVRPHDNGLTYLFDSDTAVGEHMDYSSGGHLALGTFAEATGAFAENMDRFLAGEELKPIEDTDDAYGWTMTVTTPIRRDDGSAAAYVMVDFSMDEVRREQRNFLLATGGVLAVLTAGFAAAYLVLVRRNFIQPVRQLTEVAQSYEGNESNLAFKQLRAVKGSAELRTLAEAFRMMLVEIQINYMEQQEMAVQEQKMSSDMALTSELSTAMLPKALPERESGYPFQVSGRTNEGAEMAGCFYDYFLLDNDRLCVIVGETPGSGVPQALYTMMAKATIKSHLTSGLTLAEAMSVSNRQIYEMGSGMYLNVLVGVLDGITGHFSCINAGQKDPMIMRGRDRYEWLDSFSFAPLGQNENVLYRTMELDLRQGDRLFFHTSGLDEIEGQDGKSFAQEQLRLALNERQVREADLAGQLASISEAGSSYTAQSGRIEGYAIAALEFLRRDRAQAHCVITPDAIGAAALQSFLREQMQANQISGREMAQLVVLADELFALCCRGADEDGRFLAECTVSSEERVVVLRINGAMKGRDPLNCQGEGPSYHAVNFIRENTEQASFSHEDFMDTVMIVKRLGRKNVV